MIPYSTKETKIGKWIDRKDLYRKVCVVTNIELGNQIDIETIPNVSEVTKITAIQRSTSGFSMPIPTIWQDNLSQRNSMVWVDVQSSGGKVKYQINSGWTSAAKLIIIIEYTKKN